MPETTLGEFAAWADGRARDAEGGGNNRSALEEIRGLLTQSLEASFSGSHDPDGAPFKPLKGDPFKKPLWGSGKMLARLIHAHQTARVTESELTVDVPSEISILHNFGRKKRPKREHLGFGQGLLNLASEIVAEKYADRLLRG